MVYLKIIYFGSDLSLEFLSNLCRNPTQKAWPYFTGQVRPETMLQLQLPVVV